MDPLEQLTQDFKKYAEQDSVNFAEIHAKLDGFATKEDIAELKNFMRNVNVGLGIVRFTWNNASKIGVAILFLFGIYGVIKFGVWGAAMWFFKLINGV